MADGVWKVVYPAGTSHARAKKEKNVVFNGHYLVASSRPPERRPLQRHTLLPIALWFLPLHYTSGVTTKNFSHLAYVVTPSGDPYYQKAASK